MEEKLIKLDELLLLEAASYSDWHVDIDKPDTSVVFRDQDEHGGELAEAKPSRVPTQMLPVLYALTLKLKEHRHAGDAPAFALDLAHLRFRGERMRPNRYALRRSRQGVETLKDLGIGGAVEDILLDPDFRSGGLFLIAGGTGAGKSTTARSMVRDRLEKYGGYALGVEQPIEVDFEGFHGEGYIEQVDATNMGYQYEVASAMRKFPAATRSMFFFGEVLEKDAAAELTRLIMRGHFVITTIHADSIEGAIKMLLTLAERGGETSARQLLGSSLLGVLHQKLQRGRPVVNCIKVSDQMRNLIADPTVPLSNLTSSVDAIRRERDGQMLRRQTVGQPRLTP